MKNYLARFTEAQETEGRIFEKSLPSQVSKGSKGAFDTFDPDPDKAFSNIQTPTPGALAREITIRAAAMPETCPLCEVGQTERISGDLWRCPACDYELTLAAPDFDWLQPMPAQRPAVKEPLAVSGQPSECPACAGRLDQQDKARATWWCSACRLFVIGGVQ